MGQIVAATIQTVQRIASELRPSSLDDLGLLAAVESHAEDFSRRSGLRICWAAKCGEPRLSKGAGTVMFRIFQEALTNVVRHAAARTVTLALAEADGFVVMEISDDDRGFVRRRGATKGGRARSCCFLLPVSSLAGGGWTVKGSRWAGGSVGRNQCGVADGALPQQSKFV